MTLAFKGEGEAILLIGETRGWLGRSVYLRDVCGREEGAPPPVDLAAERRHGDFVRSLIRAGAVTAVHDVSDGGLLIALAEMAMASGIGAVLEAPSKIPPHAFWFGEDQARYIVTAKDAHSVTRQADRCRRAASASRRDRWRRARRRWRATAAGRRIKAPLRGLAAGLHGRTDVSQLPLAGHYGRLTRASAS